MCIFALQKNKTGCSAVRLAHLLWEQGVMGSNPVTPTCGKKLFQLFIGTTFFVRSRVYVSVAGERNVTLF